MVDACVVRQPKAYPVYDEDYRDNVATIRLDLEGTLSDPAHGRPQRHAQIQQPGPRDDDRHADGARTSSPASALYDIWNVNEDAEYHEAGDSGVQEALESVRRVPEKVAPDRAA